MTGPTVLGEREASILRWRCRRGLLENDIFIERFFSTYGANVSEDQAFGLTLLMNLPDNDLLDLFLRRREPTGELDVARVRAVLRRSERGAVAEAQNNIMRIANIEIDLDAHSVRRDGQPIDLTPSEFNLLAALASQPGRVFSRLQLLEAAQGVAYEGYERSIDAHIKNLRAKLEPEPRSPRYIETVFGVGYRFMEAAE